MHQDLRCRAEGRHRAPRNPIRLQGRRQGRVHRGSRRTAEPSRRSHRFGNREEAVAGRLYRGGSPRDGIYIPHDRDKRQAPPPVSLFAQPPYRKQDDREGGLASLRALRCTSKARFRALPRHARCGIRRERAPCQARGPIREPEHRISRREPRHSRYVPERPGSEFPVHRPERRIRNAAQGRTKFIYNHGQRFALPAPCLQREPERAEKGKVLRHPR